MSVEFVWARRSPCKACKQDLKSQFESLEAETYKIFLGDHRIEEEIICINYQGFIFYGRCYIRDVLWRYISWLGRVMLGKWLHFTHKNENNNILYHGHQNVYIKLSIKMSILEDHVLVKSLGGIKP